MPTATPPDQVEVVLAKAVARPTIGTQRLVDHLADRGCACRRLESRRFCDATASVDGPSGWPRWPS
jgi:hypothetical protein